MIVYQCAEDNAADTIKPRLLAAEADCDKIAYIKDNNRQVTLDDNRIEQTIEALSARLCILDPLQAFLVQDGDIQNAVRMRALLGNLGRIAEKHNCAIVLISHMSKSSTGKNLYRSLGSIDIAAIARSVLMISRDGDDPNSRYMFQVKSSLAPEGPGIGFGFDRDGGLRWHRGDVAPINPLEVEGVSSANKQDSCEMMLMALLCNQEIASSEILNHFSQMGFSRRTLLEAKKKLKIDSVRKNGAWYWKFGTIITDGPGDREDEQV